MDRKYRGAVWKKSGREREGVEEPGRAYMMDNLKMHTPDLAEENFRKLAALFPHAVTETVNENGEPLRAIDADVLRREISAAVVEGPRERYRFTWPDKGKAAALANAPVAKTLRLDRSRSVGRDGARGGTDSENLYIEGDNLDALKLLRQTYQGAVKLIYIDPPYNTGSDLVYEDDFSQETREYLAVSGQLDQEGSRLVQNAESNGRFHTDWLNMLYPRLRLAKDFLSEDGVILINIDENEFENLLKLCGEVFGKSNDLGVIVWDKRNPKGDARGISCQHEYIAVYARNKAALLEGSRIRRPKKNAAAILKKGAQLFSMVSEDYTLDDANADFAEWMRTRPDFSGGERAYNRIDQNGDVYRPVSMAWPNKMRAPDNYFTPLIHPVTRKPCPVPERGWRNPPSTMRKMLREGRILFGRDEKTIPNSKYLLKENMYENIPSLLYYGGSDADLLARLGIPFDTPKVVSVCQEHIASFTKPGDLVMDFFSGSATTAHAVLQLNAESGGGRRFIMVQIPEICGEKSEARKAGYETICDIGEERIRRAGDKIREETGADIDYGFRVFRVDSTNMEDVYYRPADYEQSQLSLLAENIKPDRTPEDLLFQVMLELGILLSSSVEEEEIAGKRVFSVAGGYLLACFDQGVTAETVTEIAGRRPFYAVFRDSSMAGDSVAANFDQIFAARSPGTVRKML